MRAMKKPSLSELFRRKAFDITRCVHLAVDLQKKFCTAAQAARITDEIAPALKKLGINTYWIYYDLYEEGPEAAQEGLRLGVKPPGDRLVPKSDESAFENDELDEILHEDEARILIIDGFEFGCCVKKTAIDARKKGYTVIVLRDCTDYEYYGDASRARKAEKEMQENGVIVTTAPALFRHLKAPVPAMA